MLRRIHLSTLIVIVVCGVSCSGQLQNTHEEREAAVAKAQHAANKLMGTLLAEVQRSMKEGGAAAAVRHCADRAMELTAEISETQGVMMRRVTNRPRNPLAAPDAYEAEILSRFAAAQASGTLRPSSEVVELDGRSVLRYMRPLTMKKPCLTCHGDDTQVPGDVRSVLADRYPKDRATEYHAGDLRGAISVIVPLDEDE